MSQIDALVEEAGFKNRTDAIKIAVNRMYNQEFGNSENGNVLASMTSAELEKLIEDRFFLLLRASVKVLLDIRDGKVMH